MKSLAELDPLDLDSATKIQVAAIVKSLLEQVERDAQSLSVKDAQIQAKDFKIEAMTVRSNSSNSSKSSGLKSRLGSCPYAPVV